MADELILNRIQDRLRKLQARRAGFIQQQTGRLATLDKRIAGFQTVSANWSSLSPAALD